MISRVKFFVVAVVALKVGLWQFCNYAEVWKRERERGNPRSIFHEVKKARREKGKKEWSKKLKR